MDTVSESIKKLMAKKSSGFHEAGYVHDDLRDTNIMSSKSDVTDFKFIDFERDNILTIHQQGVLEAK